MASRRRRTRVWCKPFVCGQQLTVYLSNDAECDWLEGSEGVSHAMSSTVVIDESCSIERGEETLMHELLHHMIDISGARHNLADEFGMSPERWHKFEEKLIRHLSPAIVGSLKQNKWLRMPKRPRDRAARDVEVTMTKRGAK